MDLIYWSVRSYNRERGGMRRFVILANCEYYFIREHENLAQPSNNKRIDTDGYMYINNKLSLSILVFVQVLLRIIENRNGYMWIY